MLDEAQKNYLKSKLEQENKTFAQLIKDSKSTNEDKYSCLSNIIEFKKLLNEPANNSVYLDIKQYIKLYLNAIEEKDDKYDLVNADVILKKINGLPTEQKLNLLKLYRRELQLRNYAEHVSECSNTINKVELTFHCERIARKKSIKSLIKIIALWSSKDLKNLVYSLFAFFFLSSIFFLEAPFQQIVTLDVEFVDFSENSVLNFVLNVLTLFFDLDEGMKVKPINGFGVIQIITGKVLFLLILINFFIKRITDFLKIID